jgi:WXG100 family type VII secretion target
MTVTSSFITDVSTMTTAARHVDEVAAAIDAELRTLDARIAPIVGGWKGNGSAAYQQLHRRWMEDAGKLRQVLAEISLGLNQSGQRYQTQEDSVSAQMTRTLGSL